MAQDIEVVDRLATLKEMCPSGYALALHIHYTSARFQFISYAKGWTDHYSQNGLVMQDPVVRWGLENTGFVRWDDLGESDPGNVIGQARDHGIMNGVTCGIDDGGTRTITGFSRPSAPFSEAEIDEMERIALEIHRLTSDLNTLSPASRARLHKLSITFTHP